ncbi:MAG: hypothetical protein CVU65_08695 [Deltaproteobacteria bacterium HGW-Deltaproteobacteria-22]|nr:MAG: hypothetical protein CVU65_08695 [Deltaproteobacteria bacterium HGW-Deltaproteobacteria-22]
MRPDKYPIRTESEIHPRISELVAQGVGLSPAAQDWLSGGHVDSEWDEDIQKNLFLCMPILPLVSLQRQLDQVRTMMDNVMQHAEFTGNPELHTEVERTWSLLQEEMDRLFRNVYIATFVEDPALYAMLGVEQTKSVFRKFKVLFANQRTDLMRMEENLVEYLGKFI